MITTFDGTWRSVDAVRSGNTTDSVPEALVVNPVFSGTIREKPHLGDTHEPLSVGKARESVQIMLGVSMAMATGVVLSRAVLSLLL